MDVEDVVVVALHSLDHLAPELAELWSMVRGATVFLSHFPSLTRSHWLVSVQISGTVVHGLYLSLNFQFIFSQLVYDLYLSFNFPFTYSTFTQCLFRRKLKKLIHEPRSIIPLGLFITSAASSTKYCVLSNK